MNANEQPSRAQLSGSHLLKQLESALPLGANNIMDAIELFQQGEHWEVDLAESSTSL